MMCGKVFKESNGLELKTTKSIQSVESNGSQRGQAELFLNEHC